MFSSIIGLVLGSWAMAAAPWSVQVPVQEIPTVEFNNPQDLSELEQSITREYYVDLTGSEVITDAILQAAEDNRIPHSLAFALAMKESSFNPRDLSYNATSVDRGLFQLNSSSFPHLSDEQCFDPWLNAETGLAYLRYCWERGGNETVALAMYNAGPTRVENHGTPSVTVTYIHKINNFRARYEEELQTRLALASFSMEESTKTVKNMGSLVEHLEDIN